VTVTLTDNAKALVRSTFFAKDFETYVNELVDFIKLSFGTSVASNIVASEQGVMLIEMFAFGLSTLSWYGDRQADDTNLRDVRLRTAAVTIARQLGYKARAAIPATITLTLTLDFPPSLTRLTLEQGRVILGPGGLLFEMTEEVIFEIGEVGPKTFSAREGTTTESIFTSDGTQFQIFLMETVPTGKSIAQSTVRVFVNSIEWFESALLTYDQTNQYEVDYGLNPVRLIFGDGAAGNVPENNAEIRVSFLATSGTAGAVTSETVVAFREPLVAGTQVMTGNLSQPDPSTPGSDPESLVSIRTNAPQVFQTGRRVVTQADYDALINAFIDPIYGAVAIGRATVPRSVDQDAEALTIIAQINASCPVALVVSSSLLFQVSETVTGGTSGATGILIGVGTNLLSVASLGTGTFVTGETVTGSVSTTTTTVTAATTNEIATRLETYWNKVLASNCQVNVVIAQILAADTAGRYIAAPVGLARAVETYLDGLAESTVKVISVDGSLNLLRVTMTCDVSLLPGFTSSSVRETIRTSVSTAIQNELLGRSYGDSLRISDVYAIVEAIEGVDFTNLAISAINDAAPTRADQYGNLVIQDYEVITLGDPVVVTLL